MKLSAVDRGEAPEADWTVTSTVPNAPAGEVAQIDVGLTTMKLAAATFPNITPVTLEKFVPVMVTEEPPAEDPLVFDKLETVGAGD